MAYAIPIALLLFLPSCLFASESTEKKPLGTTTSAITYVLSGGRFGDNIMTYCKAKYLSLKYDLPLIYKPFQYADELILSQNEHVCLEEKSFSYSKHIKTEQELNQIPENTLFICHFETHIIPPKTYTQQNGIDFFYWITRQDTQIGKELKKMLTPIKKKSSLSIPKNKISVAVHVRKGGGYDRPLWSNQYFDTSKYQTNYTIVSPTKNTTNEIEQVCQVFGKKINHPHNSCTIPPDPKTNFTTQERDKNSNYQDKIHPSKFPPEQYYIDQIKKLSEILEHAPMCVYVFTDDKKPQEIVKKFRKFISNKNITFATRTTKNAHNMHVVDDVYDMAQFDCLIRSSSLFSCTSQLIGSHKIIICPEHACWVTQKNLLMDKVNIIVTKKEPFF